jgi:multicomponent Na+:H+ antiporter subunit E
MSRTVRVALALGVLYAMTLASTDPLDVATGTLLGGALLLALGRRLRLEPGGDIPSFGQRLLWFWPFVGAVLVDIAVGTWDVALRVLGLRRIERTGVVRVPIGDRTERGVAVTALTSTLSPGSVLLDVDWERGDMLVHVIDASDPDAFRAKLDRFYDRYQRKVFP